MRFIDFLDDYRWHARYREELLDATTASEIVDRIAVTLVNAPGASAGGLTIFCTFTPLETVLSYFVASRLGLLAAVLSPRNLPGFLDSLAATSVAACVVPLGRKAPSCLAAIPTLRADFGTTRKTVCTDGAPGTSGPHREIPRSRLVFSSSGSTGTPKRIVHDEHRLIGNARMVADYLGLRATDRTLCAFPPNYMYGLSTTLCTLVSGGSIEYDDLGAPSLLARHAEVIGATVLPILGDWAPALSDHWAFRGPARRPRRRIILNASDRLLAQQAARLLPHASALWNNFGQTEAGPRLFAVRIADLDELERLSCEGVVAPGFAASPDIAAFVSDNSDARGFGELFYRSPFAMQGHLCADGTIRPVDDWIASGDLFRRERDGLFRWGGRSAHAIKSNGRFIYWRSLVDNLLMHDGITGAFLTKNESGRMSLFVEHESEERQILAELTPLVARALPGIQPSIHLLPELPRTESGKVDARRLQSMCNEGVT